MIPSLCLVALLSVQTVDPPPLTAEQIERVRTLVKTHQEEQSTLREKLQTAERNLAECYSRFELDDAQVKKLQAEILEVQGKLLTGYHAMQKELRAIVGPERFAILNKRIENALRNPPDPKKNPPNPKK